MSMLSLLHQKPRDQVVHTEAPGVGFKPVRGALSLTVGMVKNNRQQQKVSDYSKTNN